MRKRPEIPEDVFFDVTSDDGQPEDEPDEEPEKQPERGTDGEVLARSMEQPRRNDPPPQQATREKETSSDGANSDNSRIGRPPAQEGPKEAVTLYLTEPVAHMLEEVKFRLLTEYDVKTSKSAIADFAIRHGLDDLQAAADDLRRD